MNIKNQICTDSMEIEYDFSKAPFKTTSFESKHHVLVTYYVESRSDPEVAARGLCNEQSASRFPGASSAREEALLRDYAAKVVGLDIISEEDHPTLNTYVDLPRFGTGPVYTRFMTQIAFPIANFRASLAGLINTIAGEPHHTGYFSALKIIDVKLPETYVCDFQGPQFGVQKIRERLNVYDRPLFCGPVKPSVGLTPDEFASQAYKAFKGGIDIVKDDELIVDTAYCPFEERVRKTMDAVKRIEDETGRARLYVAHISADYDQMRRYYETALRYNVDAVMVSPMIVGFPSLQWLSREEGLPVFSHNACMSMATRVSFFGISLHVLVQLQRLAGADVVVIPSPWGTFIMSDEDHRRNVEASLVASHDLAPIWPGLSGGKSVGTLLRCYQSVGSEDFMFIVGSALFHHPLGVEAGARSLLQAWEATQQGIELDHYAKDHKELRAAVSHFKQQHTQHAES